MHEDNRKEDNENATDNDISNKTTNQPAIPKPVFMKLITLFGGGAICLFIGFIVALVTRDLLILGMSGILFVAFIVKGLLIQQKIRSSKVYIVDGVCIGIAPKILGRYKRIELVNTDTGDDAFFILPKKVGFKLGYVYKCYFDNDIKNRVPTDEKTKNSFFNNGMDLPTNGFLGFECFGIYQGNQPAVEAATKPTIQNKKDGEDKNEAAAT